MTVASGQTEPTSGMPQGEELYRWAIRHGKNYVKNGRVEALPDHFGPGTDEIDGDADTSIMLKAMSGEFHFGHPESKSQMIERAYRVARNIGELRISRKSQAAFDIIDGARSGLRGRLNFAVDTSSDNLGAVREVRPDEPELYASKITLSANIKELYSGSNTVEGIKHRLREAGVNIEPAEVSFLAFMHTAAHETGHVIQNSIGRLRPYVSSTHTMSDMVLEQVPALGLTPNVHTNIHIHTERFAEGYAHMVLQEIMRVQGYTPEQADAMKNALTIDTVHPEYADALAQLDDKKTIKDVNSDLYTGYLGYTKPLSEAELIADLETVEYLTRVGVTEPLNRADIEIAYGLREKPEVEELPKQRKHRMLGTKALSVARNMFRFKK